MVKPQASDLPTPFQFNAWKHHLTFVQNQVVQIQHLNEMLAKLPGLGNSVMDVYTGKLSLAEIQAEIALYLHQHDLFPMATYINWIRPDEYKLIQIRDQSRWTLRVGNDPDYYVHLHPARHSPLTFRIKANLLKTAVMLAWQNDTIDLQLINQIREKHLQLSPLKAAAPGLIALVKLIRQV